MEDGDIQTINDNLSEMEKGLTEQLQAVCTGLGSVKERVVAVETMVKTEGARCPYREDIHSGVQAKSEVHELAVAVNGKLDGIRKDIKDMGVKVTNNRFSIKTWGGLITGSGVVATILVKVADRFI